MKTCSRCGRVVGDYEFVCPTCGSYFNDGVSMPVSPRSPYEVPSEPNKQDFGDNYVMQSYVPPVIDSRPVNANYNPPAKRNNAPVILLGVAASVVVIILALTAILIISPGKSSGGSGTGGGGMGGTTPAPTPITRKLQVPDVVGFQIDIAKQKLTQSGFTYAVEYRTVDDMVSDLVIEQSPEPYTFVDKAVKVKLVVSKLQENSPSESETDTVVQVPNVVGYYLEDAQSRIKDCSLIPRIKEYRYSETVEENRTISQDPEGDNGESSYVKKNSEVFLVVSKGKDMSNYVKLEDYTGRDINDVKKELEGAGLKVAYTYGYSDSYPKDAVISQDTPEGTYVEKGKTVSFLVSQGKESSPTSSDSSDGKPVFHNVMASSTLKPEPGYTYDVTNALHDDNTCWSEGVDGDGIGEYIMMYDNNVQTVSGCQIKNGYTKDKTTFNNNSRMSKVTFEFSNGETYTADIDPDDMGLQTIEFPQPVETTYLKIIIADTKTGDKYEDTSITLVVPY